MNNDGSARKKVLTRLAFQPPIPQQGCRNPGLEGRGPAGFSVLPSSQLFPTCFGKSHFLLGRIENLAELQPSRTGVRHLCPIKGTNYGVLLFVRLDDRCTHYSPIGVSNLGVLLGVT